MIFVLLFCFYEKNPLDNFMQTTLRKQLTFTLLTIVGGGHVLRKENAVESQGLVQGLGGKRGNHV